MLNDDNKKSTLEVDENDILKMAEIIQQNIMEDKYFSKELDEYINSTGKTSEPLIVGRTPNSLSLSGANPNLNVVIAPNTISKCMSEDDEKYHGHGLSAEIMKQLPSELRNPAMIFKGNKDNSLVAITELKDKENREIMIAVALSDKKGFKEVNRISSAYGRNNMTNFLQAQMSQGNLIAVNKEKANKMLHSAGLQLPLENTFISFNNSIAYTDKNVKRENIEKTDEKIKFVCFRKYDNTVKANVIFKGKSKWCEIRSRGGKMYVNLSENGAVHKLTVDQSERFSRFLENNDNITGEKLSKNKTSDINKKIERKGLKC